MLHDGRRAFRTSAHLAVFGRLTITLAVVAINLGDGMRHALDPRAEKEA